MPKRDFQELNETGTRTYGLLWPGVNEAAVDAAIKYGMKPWEYGTQGPNKDKIVAIVLAVMDKLNAAGVIKIPARDVKDYIMKSPTFLERELRAKREQEG